MAAGHAKYWLRYPKPARVGLLNAEYVKQALAKVLDPHVLVNLVARRVRELNSGRGPLISNTGTLCAADIALLEIIGDKMSFEMPARLKLVRLSAQEGKRPAGWMRAPTPKTESKL